MTELFFIRHAETDMAGTFCGQSDPPVNYAGQRQIDTLLQSMRNERLDAVYTSDLQRAMTTAAALAEFSSIPCVVLTELREINFGRWEGLTWKQIEALDADYATRWLSAYPELPAPEGEPIETFESRVIHSVTQLVDCTAYRQIAIVSHAGVMRTLLRAICDTPEPQARAITASYCCIYRHTFKPRPALVPYQ